MKSPHKLPELLAPAGSFDAALAAFTYGADAVYLGLNRFSARADATNFTLEQLAQLLAYARSLEKPRKIYVTLNTLMETHEREALLPFLGAMEDLAVDGAIIQDLGIASLLKRNFPKIPRHASTQLACTSTAGARALVELGFERIVTARELALEEAAAIGQAVGTEIEVFIHGALCYAISGLCLYSSMTTGRSGNRGRCAYCCRQRFTDIDGRAHHPYSMRDLALLTEGEALRTLPLASLKIEGRMKNPLYVAAVTDLYRHLLDNTLSPEELRAKATDLKTIFSRPWTSLYAKKLTASPESIIDPLCVGHRGAPIGSVQRVERDARGARWLTFRTQRALEKHDGLQIDPPEGGRPIGFPVDKMRDARSHKPALTLPAGSAVEIMLPQEVTELPRGATIYCSASQAVRRAFPFSQPRATELRTLAPADLTLTLAPHEITLSGNGVTLSQPAELPPAQHPDRSYEAAKKLLSRLGEEGFFLRKFTFNDPHACFLPASVLNNVRRAWAEQAREKHAEAKAKQRRTPSLLPEREAPFVAAHAPRLTVKCSVLHSPDLFKAHTPDQVVVTLTSQSTLAELESWLTALPREQLRIALPIALRDAEMEQVGRLLVELVSRGYRRFEVPDLSAYQLLQAYQPHCDAFDITADWSWYAINPEGVALQEAFGICGAVTGPEANLPNLQRLPEPFPRELLIAQYTPLFISYTKPLTPADLLTDRNGLPLRVAKLGSLWVTFAERPWCLPHPLPEGISCYRIDLSWAGTALPDADWRSLMKGSSSPYPCAFNAPRL